MPKHFVDLIYIKCMRT